MIIYNHENSKKQVLLKPVHPPSGYLKRGCWVHLIMYPPQDTLEVLHRITVTQPLLRHGVDGLYDL